MRLAAIVSGHVICTQAISRPIKTCAGPSCHMICTHQSLTMTGGGTTWGNCVHTLGIAAIVDS